MYTYCISSHVLPAHTNGSYTLTHGHCACPHHPYAHYTTHYTLSLVVFVVVRRGLQIERGGVALHGRGLVTTTSSYVRTTAGVGGAVHPLDTTLLLQGCMGSVGSDGGGVGGGVSFLVGDEV
mgnify:CR=1 FL=1